MGLTLVKGNFGLSTTARRSILTNPESTVKSAGKCIVLLTPQIPGNETLTSVGVSASKCLSMVSAVWLG